MAAVPKKVRTAALKKGIYLLPNLLTTGALFAGFYAVVAAIDGNFKAAGIAIFIAMILDGMDGRVARMTSTESDFGKEYDSLSDMVSFGVAPALVVYQWGAERLAEYGWAWGTLGWLATFFYAVAAALRLARFNSRPTSDKRYFEGLPSPSAAGLVAGAVWLGTDLQVAGLTGLALGFLVTVAAGSLMVSNLLYFSFKKFNLGERVPFGYILVIPLIFILIALSPPAVLFATFFLYAISAPLAWAFRRWDRRQLQPQAPRENDDV